jgi:hypothetical protein
MINPTDNDLIERYLLGKLSREEIRGFETRLDDDREFARKLRLLKTFPEMMSEPARIEYERMLAEAAMPVVKKKRFIFRKPIYLLLVVVASLLFIVIALLFIFTGKSHQKENVIREENVVQKEDVVKSVVAPRKDILTVTTPVPQPEKKEAREVISGSGQKTIELLNPANGIKLSRKEMILFNWAQRTDSFTRFYIFSELNDHVMFWRGIRPGIREYKVPGNYLFPGKYYWYVGTKKEIHKFIITE